MPYKRKCLYNIDTQSCDLNPSNKDIQNVASVFGRAFNQYPLFRETLPDETTRKSKLTDLHSMLVCYGLKNGNVYTTRHNESVLITTHQKGKTVHNLDMVKCGAIKIPFKLGKSFLNRQQPYEDAMNKLHEQSMPQEHVYIWAIGTDPQEQGHGHGKRLLTKAIQDASEADLPLYLETVDPKNVDIYQSLGFTLAGQKKVGNITTFGMTLTPSKKGKKY